MITARKKRKQTWLHWPNESSPYLIDVNTASVDSMRERTWIKLTGHVQPASSWTLAEHPSRRKQPPSNFIAYFMEEKQMPQWIQERIAVLRMGPQRHRIKSIGTCWDTALFTLEIGFE